MCGHNLEKMRISAWKLREKICMALDYKSGDIEIMGCDSDSVK